MSASDVSSDGNGRQAVVLGAGLAGLVAARVLADHFGRVTIVEQDLLPSEPSPRAGAPQSQHVHVLLHRGRLILDRLFPGLQDDLTRAGAPRVDGIQDVAWLTAAGWAIRFPSKYVGRSASRPLLEWAIRQRLRQDPRVRFVEERSAIGLLASDDRTRVRGVRVRPRSRDDVAGGVEETLIADLVVDATGRGSRATTWLHDLGYPEPSRSEINAHLGYATRYYRLPADPVRDWQGLYVQAKLPTDLRGGVLMRLENDTWICTLGGYGKDYPPTDEDGFLAFARSLRVPFLYEAIQGAEPLTPPVTNRSSANVWRHYEKLSRWPDGFIAVGDAVCAFNPVYGQGMTVAAQEAMLLDTCLRDQGRRNGDFTGLAERFQRQLPRAIGPVWTIATGEDVRVPGAEGGRPGRIARLVQGYFARVVQLTTEDVFARQIFTEVLNLERPMWRLFHPRLIAKVILGPTGRAAPGPGVPARAAPA